MPTLDDVIVRRTPNERLAYLEGYRAGMAAAAQHTEVLDMIAQGIEAGILQARAELERGVPGGGGS